ncbi:MAG: hypothetical protein C4519_25745 [Desulfobacteraceae bacterium]|nr:MAG: hypothetical protein C4519_25745 [Desulfobacteraceae bacterium]
MDDTQNLPDERILPVLVAQVYNRAGLGVIGTVINASILTYLLWGLISNITLTVWMALTLLSAGIRLIVLKKFKKQENFARNIHYWRRWLIFGLGLSGILWGSSAIFLFPAGSTAHQAFIAFLIAGMVAGAVGTFSAVMAAFLAFSIPALLPLIIRFFMLGDPLHLAMAFMTVLFAVLTFTTAKHISNSILELVVLKETFFDQLEHRTAELQRLNERFSQEIAEHKKTEKALRASEAQIEKALEEKTILLQEIHHRVKNNMQVIISLMHLQSAQIKEEKVQSSFKEASSRVNAMALIHNILYESNSISEVHLSEYLQRLTDSLVRMYDAGAVQIEIQANGCRLNMDQAIPCGLILNELISNSLKHAFSGPSGQIRIEAFPCEKDHYVLLVQDNGIGLPDHIDLHHASTLGLRLVRGLTVHQLGGRIEVDRSKQGTCYRLEFGGQ